MKERIKNEKSAVPASSATSYMKRKIAHCYIGNIACAYTYQWVKTKVRGNGKVTFSTGSKGNSMKMLILKVALTVATFLVVLTVMGGGFGVIELSVWLVAQIAVIAFFFTQYRKSTAGGSARNH